MASYKENGNKATIFEDLIKIFILKMKFFLYCIVLSNNKKLFYDKNYS